MSDGSLYRSKKNRLRSDELLIDVVVPRLPPRSGAAFFKVGRVAEDISIVNAAAFVTLENDGTCRGNKIAVGGGMGPVVKRARKAEVHLKGQKPESDLIHQTPNSLLRNSLRGRPPFGVLLNTNWRSAEFWSNAP